MAKGKSSASKGTTRQLKKNLRENIKAISRGSIRRLARRGGIKRLAGDLHEEVRRVLKVYVEDVVRTATSYTEYARHKTVKASDIVAALRKKGQILYGYA